MILSVFIYSGIRFFVFSQTIEEFIDINGLKKTGDDWEIRYSKIEENRGHIKLHQDKWLMYFLHWRPLTEENRNINLLYARHQLLNFWGPNMAFFELGNCEGELEINGHKAYYVNGTFSKIVDSRFIIWNCPQTGRQFIADLNVNKRRGTPKFLHELQQLITMTINCHQGTENNGSTILPQKYESEKYSLSFHIPENWRTNDFDYEEWFPERMSDTCGTLWTLLTDSEKHIELLWKKTDKKISENLLTKYLKEIEAFKPVPEDSSRYFNFTIEKSEKKDIMLICSGKYRLGTHKQRYKDFSNEYFYKGFLWKNGKQSYFLLASLVNVQEFWQRSVDLLPTKETFDNYIQKEIVPNIKTLRKKM